MRIAAVCLAAVLVGFCRQAGQGTLPAQATDTAERQQEVRKVLSSHWGCGLEILRGPLSLRAAEKELDEMARIVSDGDGSITFKGPVWRQLKARLKPGDEFYFYKTDCRSWAELLGSEGYVAVRGNEVIGSLIIGMN